MPFTRSHKVARRSAIALAIVPLTIFSTSTAALAAEADQVNLNVLGITDFHGHISGPKDPSKPVKEMGAGAMACYIDKERAANPATSFVSAGDNIGGSPFVSSILDDEPTISSLNAMGLEASAVGNHEFDKGWDDLRDRVGVDGTKLAEFPYLAANVTGATMAPSTVVDKDGVKIGYVGAVTETTPTLVSPSGVAGLNFSAPVAAADAEANHLKESGEADVVVALVHEGVSAEGFGSNVDAVIGGHTHQEQENNRSQPVVIQPASYGSLLADIDITYDKAENKVDSVSARNIPAQDVWNECGATPNQEVANIVNAAEQAAEVEGQKVVATIDNDFYRGVNSNGVAGGNRGAESSLNSLLADVALDGINEQTSLNADIGVMNAGGVRDDLESGDVTFAEAYGVQPFGNSMGVVEISGAELKGVMEQQWRSETGGDRPTLILGFSENVEYSYDPEAPLGKRITHVRVNGEDLDEARNYRVAGASFLLGEGDAYTQFNTQSGDNVIEDSGIMDVDIFNRYLADHQDVQVRDDQTSVGVHISGGNADGTVTAGQKLTIDLSSLSYTASESKPTEVAAELLGGEKTVRASAPVDNTVTDNQNETGRATVQLTVPQGATELKITDDNGTEFVYPLVAQEGGPLGSLTGSSDLSSTSLGSLSPRDLGAIGLAVSVLGLSAAFGAAVYWWQQNRR